MNERFFRIFKKLLGILIRPTLTGASNLPQDPAGIVYVLYHQSVTDLAMLDLGASAAGLVSPSAPYTSDQGTLAKRYLNLFQARQGRLSLSEHSRELAGLMDLPADIRQTITLVPVSVFWGSRDVCEKENKSDSFLLHGERCQARSSGCLTSSSIGKIFLFIPANPSTSTN